MLCVLFAQTLSSEEVLECSLCYERYDDNKRCPRLLSNCGHTFCTHCLEQLLKDGSITCPQDRKDVHVTAGVGGLPKNFALLDVLLASSHKQPDTAPVLCDTCGKEGHPATSYCLECKENMCDVAAQFHTRLKVSRDHRVLSIAELKGNPHLAAIPVFCPEHNEPFRYFDKDCGQVICRDCQALEHNGHKCCSLAEASAQNKQDLEALTSKAKSTAVQLKEAEERVMTVLSDLNLKKKHEEDKMHAFFKEVSAFSLYLLYAFLSVIILYLHIVPHILLILLASCLSRRPRTSSCYGNESASQGQIVHPGGTMRPSSNPPSLLVECH